MKKLNMKPYLKRHRWQLLAVLALVLGTCAGLIDPAVGVGTMLLMPATTTTGQLGNGTILRISAGSPTSYLVINNARNVSFDTGSSAKVDMTNMTSDWKEFLLGLPDPGSLTFEVDTNFGDAGQAALRAARVARTRCDFQVQLPGGTTPTATMQGFVAKFPVETGVDAPVKTQVEVFLSGPITLA